MRHTLIAFVLLLFVACNNEPAKPAAEETKPAVTETPSSNAVTVLSPESTQILQNGVKAYVDGNLEAFLAVMEDNVKIYYPGPGDSLVGKEAIKAFFKNRQDSIVSAEAINPVYLGVDVPPGNAAGPGKWVMAWYTWNIKYKNGKTARFPIQVTEHLSAQGKVDMGIWYYDMARAYGNPPKAMK